MVYQPFQDKKISALGMGAMRLPVMSDNYAQIDEEATKKMVSYAMEKGVNYYDTAWGYHDGRSEVVLGKALRPYPRGSYYLADKFPGYDLSNMDKVRPIFEEQLVRCGVDYFDFYLFHNVCEMNIDAYLDEKYGIDSYLAGQKKAGRIRHLGFSAHGSIAVMKRFLEAYGEPDGVLPNSAQLFGLDLPGRKGQGGAAGGIPDSRVGYGASSRRQARGAWGKGHCGAQNAAPR